MTSRCHARWVVALVCLGGCVKPDVEDCEVNARDAAWEACEEGKDVSEQRSHISDPACLAAWDAAYDAAYATCLAGGDHTG